MFRPLQFEPEMESLVRFVEETDPDRIVEETIAKLKGGLSTKSMLTASALAVSRSTDVNGGHHGGPLHTVCGIYPALRMSERLPDDWAHMPIVQSVHLSNKHLHSPEMGPFITPESPPVSGRDIQGLTSKGYRLDDDREAFKLMMQMKYPHAAEALLMKLLLEIPRYEVLDLILSRATQETRNDDHYFLFPMYNSRALDAIGWEWAHVLLRPVVRWQARNPYRGKRPEFEEVEQLLEKYRLLEIGIAYSTTSAEDAAIGDIASRIGACDDFGLIPEILASSFADGMSLEGIGEALSVGASTIFLRTDYGNPMDAHLQTGANSRRYLLSLEGVSLQNKLLGLFTWHMGPEIRNDLLAWAPVAERETLDRVPDLGQEGMLDAIRESILSMPEVEDITVSMLPKLATAPELRNCMALAQRYAERGFDPMALFQFLGKITCQDDFTESHAPKHHQAVVDEYYSTREPYRWVHLVSAVKHTAICYGKWQNVYQEAKEILSV